jgi:hypothetical protein
LELLVDLSGHPEAWYEIGDSIKGKTERMEFQRKEPQTEHNGHKDNPFSDNLHESGYGIIFTHYNAGLPAAKFPYR